MPGNGFGGMLGLHVAPGNLDGGISVLILILHLGNYTWTSLDNGARDAASILVEDAGHAQLFTD
jgi:hypothetical protein